MIRITIALICAAVIFRLRAVASRSYSAGPSAYNEFKEQEMSMFEL